MPGEFTSQSYTQSELVFYNRSAGTAGIYLEWERITQSGVSLSLIHI
jgi:hypothetical protein